MKLMNPIEAYRVKDWYYYLGFIVLGFFLVSPFSYRLVILGILGSSLLAYAFSFNDFCDEGKKAYFSFPLILSILSLAFLNLLQIFLSILFLLIVTFYSAKPFRLKSKPFISSLCNGIGFSILFLLGYSVQSLDLRGLMFFLLFLSFNLVAQFIHEVVHSEEDRKKKMITTAVFLGERKIRKLCCIFLWLSFFTAFFLFYFKFVDLSFVFVTLLFVSFFSHRMFRSRVNKRLREEYKVIGLVVGLVYFLLIL